MRKAMLMLAALSLGGPVWADELSVPTVIQRLSRGLKPAKPAMAAPAQPGQPQAAAPPEAEAPSVSLSVQFANGSAQLTPAAMHTLDVLGQALSSPALMGDRFRIEGHTDTLGSAELNRALSKARADAVVSYLGSRYHVAASRLDPVGRGTDGLLVPTPDQTAEPRNRRVQVVNLGV